MGNNSSKTSSDVSSTASDARSSKTSGVTTTSSFAKTTSSAFAKSTSTSSKRSSTSTHKTTTKSSSTFQATSNGFTYSTSIALTSPTSFNLYSSSTYTSSSLSTSTISSSSSTLTTSTTLAAAASTTAAFASSTHSHISSGAIAAAVVVPVVVILALLAFFFLFLRRRRSTRAQPRLPSPGFSAATTAHLEPTTPSVSDGEKVYEKDMELTPIQRSAPNTFASAIPSASYPSDPTKPRVASPPTLRIFPTPTTSLQSSVQPSPEHMRASPNPRHLSGSTLLPPVLPEMDTGHFFDSERPSRAPSSHDVDRDPFSDPRPGYTPSPIERYHAFPGRFADVEPVSPINYDVSAAEAVPASTLHSQTQPNKNQHRLSAVSLPDDEAEAEAEADEEPGIVEYATATRVATVAHVVSGGVASSPVDRDHAGHGRHNRQSVGVVTLGRAGSVAGGSVSGRSARGSESRGGRGSASGEGSRPGSEGSEGSTVVVGSPRR